MLRPQTGPQEAFLSSGADLCIYGGAAGGGKTWALLLEPLRHVHNRQFACVIFRRTYPQVTNPGGLWDEAMRIYPHLGARPRQSDLTWVFPSGAQVRFAHLQHEGDKYNWQGAQIPLIGFDELTHFSRAQFLYLLSRNRSLSGVRPYMRATTNPDADSWVKELLAPWVDDEHPEFPFAPGAVRWFTVENDAVTWVGPDWRDENGLAGKSLSFVPARVTDNRILLAENPEYLASLRALPLVEQRRLLHGDWKVRPAAGKVFNRAWFEVAEVAPAGGQVVRFWDFAATAKKLASDDPDWTVGVKMRRHEGLFFVEDVVRVRAAWPEVKRLVRATATLDGLDVRVGWEIEPGASGKAVSAELVQALAGFDAHGVHPAGDKVQRASGMAAQTLGGHVRLVRGAWNSAYLAELHSFPDVDHDDQVDASSGAFNLLAGVTTVTSAAAAVTSERSVRELFG